MIHTIQNDYLTVSADELGAQLMSIRTACGVEALWQGDPAYWCDRALNLFPYVARLWHEEYEMDGERYRMPIHGFAPTSSFVLADKRKDCMTFELCDSVQTRTQYPRAFAFRVIYALDKNTLSCTFEVENRDNRTMYFGLGGHPGFNVPLESGKRFEDYRMRFTAPCTPVRVGFSEDCFLNGEDKPFALDENHAFQLDHHLFDNDAIVLQNMAREVTLEAIGGGYSITVSFPDMPYLGIWHWPRTDAPYVCIEPWVSLPARRGEVAVLERQKDLIRLESGNTYANTWTICIQP